MRVVAGELRGRRIESPLDPAHGPRGRSRAGESPRPTTRPTTDKVREAVFNSLESMGEIDGARVADLFAGTGAMGIEALSRGAAHCTFVENDRDALEVLGRNISSLGLGLHSTVVRADAATTVPDGTVTVVIADPPYDFEGWDLLLARLGRALPGALIVAEAPREVPAPEGWESLRCKRYGRTTVTFLRVGPLEPVP